ncbi:hypothetical protein SAMN04489724_1948 [Algoriphagus locisalis]|uniref:Uncharacterized protein n=1 Tax=Algoriphagus locisalis TaxID=305507 RepID=A0A1I7AGB8_9BACT|nr:hypothetical protein [Algoriphagus locisalis]SFT73986.1 hypothetical protein SAMN04489724_1948 [Algoriphagus locisalis]
METIVIEVESSERSKEIKTALKALNIKFFASDGGEESKIIAESVAQGYKEMLDVKAGKLNAKDARDLID